MFFLLFQRRGEPSFASIWKKVGSRKIREREIPTYKINPRGVSRGIRRVVRIFYDSTGSVQNFGLGSIPDGMFSSYRGE